MIGPFLLGAVRAVNGIERALDSVCSWAREGLSWSRDQDTEFQDWAPVEKELDGFIEDVRKAVAQAQEPTDLYALIDSLNVTIDPLRCGGRPTINGTRFPVEDFIDTLTCELHSKVEKAQAAAPSTPEQWVVDSSIVRHLFPELPQVDVRDSMPLPTGFPTKAEGDWVDFVEVGTIPAEQSGPEGEQQ